MDKFLYQMLFLATSFLAGTSGYALIESIKLYWMKHERQYIAYALGKIGFLFMAGTLLWALMPVETIPPNVRAWAYLTGTSLAGVGILWFTRLHISPKLVLEEIAREESQAPD